MILYLLETALKNSFHWTRIMDPTLYLEPLLSLLPECHPESLSSFANLTPVCFTLLCDHLSLADLLSASRVNHHWRAHVFSYNRARMCSLEFLDTGYSSAVQHYPPASVTHSHLLTNEDGSRMFPDVQKERYSLKCSYNGGPRFSLPLIQSLKSHFCTSAPLHTLVLKQSIMTDKEMLTLFHLLSLEETAHLTTLKLSFSSLLLKEQSKFFRFCDLFDCINKLHHLECLSLKFNSSLNMEPDLQVLGWLREFEFFSGDKGYILGRTLARLKHVIKPGQLRKFIYGAGDIDPLYVMKKHTSRHLTAFHVTTVHSLHSWPNLNQLPESLERHYPSLTYLRFQIYNSDFHRQLSELARALPRLLDLKLCLQEQIAQPNVEHLFQRPPPPEPLPQFTAVRTLSLHCRLQDHTQLEPLELPHFFPRLQVFQVYYLTSELIGKRGVCLRCHPFRFFEADWSDAEPECTAAFRKCSRGTLSPWIKIKSDGASSNLRYASINDLPVKEL